MQGLYLFPYHPSSYILLLTTGKTFSNLPEFTWADYNKMAPAMPPLVQGTSPIPCTPQVRPASQSQPPSQAPVQQPQQQQLNSGCCAPALAPHTAHNCHIQVPHMHTQPGAHPAFSVPNSRPIYPIGQAHPARPTYFYSWDSSTVYFGDQPGTTNGNLNPSSGHAPGFQQNGFSTSNPSNVAYSDPNMAIPSGGRFNNSMPAGGMNTSGGRFGN